MREGIRIMIAEADGATADLLTAVLEEMGCEVVLKAASCEGAVEGYKAGRPDAVFINRDLGGPARGIVVANEIGAVGDAVIVYLAGNLDDDPIEGNVGTGCAGCVCLPVDRCQLSAVIRTAVEVCRLKSNLREREDLLRAVFDANPEPVLVVGADGAVLTMNPSFARLAGKNDRQMPGLSYRDCVPEDFGASLKRGIEAVMGSGASVRFSDHCADRTYEHHFTPVKGAGGAIDKIVVLSIDVTRHVANIRALRESEERYRTAIENSNDGIAIARDGCYSFANKRFVEMFGYDSLEDIVGKPLSLTVHRDEIDRVNEINTRHQNGKNGPASFEFKGIRKDQTPIFAEASTTGTFFQGEPITVTYLRDVTERRRMEEELRVERMKFQKVLDSAPIGLALISGDGMYTYINPRFREIFGYELEDIPDGRVWFGKVFPDPTYRRNVVRDWVEDFRVNRTQSGPRVYAVTCKDGSAKIVSFQTVVLESGEYITSCEDVTERTKFEWKLTYLATHDALTGLFNRHSLEEALKRAIAHAKRGAQSSLIYMDLDNFKTVNDTLGHHKGDEVLIALTALLKEQLRMEDVIFRLGGDEFAILLDGILLPDARVVAERLRDEVGRRPFKLGDSAFSLTLSLGIIEIDGSQGAEALLSGADAAMYRAKELGKNMVVQAECP